VVVRHIRNALVVVLTLKDGVIPFDLADGAPYLRPGHAELLGVFRGNHETGEAGGAVRRSDVPCTSTAFNNYCSRD